MAVTLYPDLKGATVVVTGGSMGIGYACAEELLLQGCRVVISARTSGPLQHAADELAAATGGDVRAVPADVSDVADVERLAAAAAEVGNLRGVVHAAGIYGPIGPAWTVDLNEWWNAVRVNLLGSLIVSRTLIGLLQRQRSSGSIVLMAGGGAASPFPNYTSYACSKVAIVRLAETLAQELVGTGIRVNSLAPGFVATRLHDQTLEAKERAGDFLQTTVDKLEHGAVPAAVPARAASFLISSASNGITGRFVAAPYDHWSSWPKRLEELGEGDLFTLRRIVPRDRGKDWQ